MGQPGVLAERWKHTSFLSQPANSMSKSQTNPTATIFLARHATPDWSRRDIRYDVPPGPPLVPDGETEAAKLGEFLRAAGVTKVYASPLERTRRTAEIVGEVSGAPVEEQSAIAEYRREEDEATVRTRMLTAWQAIVDESRRNGPIAIVSHGGPVRVLLEHFGVDHDELWHYRRQFDHQNPLPPAGVWAVTINGDEQPHLELAFSPGPFTRYPN